MRIGQNRLELALLGLVAVVCTGLSVLQYRWTGEVSRAERTRLGSGLNEQVLRLARAFDDEISESCKALMPDATEIRGKGMQEAHQSHYKDWAASHERRLFDRIGFAAPDGETLRLFGFDGEGRVTPMDWPAHWETLRTAMTARMQAAGPPPAARRTTGFDAHRSSNIQ